MEVLSTIAITAVLVSGSVGVGLLLGMLLDKIFSRGRISYAEQRKQDAEAAAEALSTKEKLLAIDEEYQSRIRRMDPETQSYVRRWHYQWDVLRDKTVEELEAERSRLLESAS